MTVSVPATGVSSTVANVLPSVSTILPPKSTCSVNDALTSVLCASGVVASCSEVSPQVANTLPETSSPVTRLVVATSSDSESQGGETDPPSKRKTGW